MLRQSAAGCPTAHRLAVDKVFEGIVLLQPALGDEVAKMMQFQRRGLRGLRQPGQFQPRLLEVALQVQLCTWAAR